jgi:hypothetical protein
MGKSLENPILDLEDEEGGATSFKTDYFEVKGAILRYI